MITQSIRKIITNALKEDIGKGDITTEVFVDKKALFKGIIIAKSDMVLCGVDFAEFCFKFLNRNAKMVKNKKDGDFVRKKDVIMEVISNRTILSAERTALNILQRLSGIATKTKRFVDIAKPYGVSVYDTRKTAPNLRIMEKYAVSCGGGVNHRFGLFDAFMIKDNHIESFKTVDEISKRVELTRKRYPEKEIEIEVQNFKQLKDFINLDVDVIMIDNMSVKEAKKAIEFIRKHRRDIEIEISGGINENNFEDYVKILPDRISIGGLTHSYNSVDISLEIKRIR